LEIIIQYPGYTAEQIAVKTYKTPRTIENHISQLRKDGAIIRRGANKGGYWEIFLE
jgi:predicted HTH transcriptional regulator